MLRNGSGSEDAALQIDPRFSGTFEGEVKVVEESDYADIQRLLQSGKVLMDKMGDEGGGA